MELNIYEVIKGAWITTKAYDLNQKMKQLVLEVHPHANKPLIEQALRKLFNVEAESIRVGRVKGKKRRSGRQYVSGRLRKKAVITLIEGHSIDLHDWNKTSVEAPKVAPKTT